MVEIRVRGFETAHPQERTAPVENIVGHRIADVHGAGSGIEQTRITFVESDHPITFLQECLGDAADHGVHTGCGAAARKNSNCLVHVFAFYVILPNLRNHVPKIRTIFKFFA